jgi:fucose 4-O-acetylase-like acetyltransferase
MAKEGRNTLVYYMYHTLFLFLFFDLAERFDIPVNIGVLVLVTLLIMTIIFAMCRIKVFLWLLNPVSSILARHKKNG